MRLVVAFIAGAALGLGAGYVKWNWSAQREHWTQRLGAIVSQADQMPPGGVVVLGDSVTEYNRFDSLCGRPALNAGIAWARTADWLPDAGRVITEARPSLVILALGLNDRDSADWRNAYRKLASLTHARLAIGTDDPAKDAFIRSGLPLAPRPSIARYGKHPNAAGAALWRSAINRACPKP